MSRILQAFGRLWIEFRHGRSQLIDPITGLTDEEKKLIQDSSEKLMANSSETGIEILYRFFSKYPQYLKLYSFKDVPSDKLKYDEAFLKECNKLMYNVNIWIKTLENPSELRDILRKSGEQYIGFGFPEQYFWNFEETFVEYLVPLMDNKSLEAWTKLIKFAMKILVSSLN